MSSHILKKSPILATIRPCRHCTWGVPTTAVGLTLTLNYLEKSKPKVTQIKKFLHLVIKAVELGYRCICMCYRILPQWFNSFVVTLLFGNLVLIVFLLPEVIIGMLLNLFRPPVNMKPHFTVLSDCFGLLCLEICFCVID